jgi:hypothetical protein
MAMAHLSDEATNRRSPHDEIVALFRRRLAA